MICRCRIPDSPAYRALSFGGPLPPEWRGPLADLVNGLRPAYRSVTSTWRAARGDAARVGENQYRMCAPGYTLLTTPVIDHAAVAVAYSEVLVSEHGLHQEDTYGRPGGRGHRPGALAKARNLRARAGSHPGARHVHTWAAEVNDPMRRINESVGFRPVETVYALEARLDDRAV